MTPFFRVYMGKQQVEITEQVESFKFEDCTEEDDMLNLSVAVDLKEITSGSCPVKEGSQVQFVHGMLGGARSPVHKARVSKVDYKYGQRVVLTVKALDLGTMMKRDGPKTIWKGKTSAEIVEEMAKKYNMDYVVDVPTKTWDSLPQAGKTDYELLEYMSKREGDGNYVFYIKGDRMFYIKRKTKADSEYNFVYGQDERIVEFNVKYDEVTKSGKGADSVNLVKTPQYEFIEQVQAEIDIQRDNTRVEPVVPLQIKATNTTETPTGTMGESKRQYNAGGDFTGNIVSEENVYENTGDNAEAEALANSKKKAASKKVLTATLKLYNVPGLRGNSVITMSNVEKKHLGNWYVKKVVYDGTGYCDAELSKDGTKAKGGEKAKDANTSEGRERSETIRIRVYDENGNFTGFRDQVWSGTGGSW